jgi:hypothetical protein
MVNNLSIFYIFLEFFSLKYHYTLSLNKYIYLNIWESLNLLNGIFYRYLVFHTKQPPTLASHTKLPPTLTSHIELPPTWLKRMNQIVRIK